MKLSTDQMIQIERYFFKEGCALVEARSEELHDTLKIKNSELRKFFRSLCSKGIAREQFVWRHAYYFLTTAGISILREKLYLSEEDLPQTHQDSATARIDRVENVVSKTA